LRESRKILLPDLAMKPSIRTLPKNPNILWALALLACSVASFIIGGMTQERALPSAIDRLGKLKAAMVAQDEEFEGARLNAERRIAVMAARIEDMKSVLAQMETWQVSLREMSGEASFTTASAEIVEPPAAFSMPANQGGIDLIAELNFLSARMNHRFEELRSVSDALTAEGARAMFSPSGWPVESRRITSHRGFRKDPFTGKRQWHDGIDIDGDTGDPIYAVAPGVVTWAGRRSSYGELVEVSHAGGYVTRYAHNSLNLVAVGDYVQRGQEIARIGRTGRVTGSSLHFEVLRNGVSVNPIEFLRKAPG